MTQPQIKDIFNQRYNQTKWKQFLGQTFANAQLLSTPKTLTGIDINVASNAQNLGYILLDENGIERQIAVYEVTLAPGIILERNRVGLRNLLRKYWQNIDAAFIAYHRPESANWRFSYVSELTGYDAEGESIKIKTEPKRYTYLLGESESIRTAVERFERIIKKGSKATLDDVKEAFSVEKLSKTFFDEYKKHYDIFCKYMVSQPGIYQTIFNGDEKAIRDFNKKLLGRIVFIYFIQKKGWLGVPKNESWGKGDFNFLTNHFQNFQHPELFYQDFLSVLFFDTLNTKRPDDLIELVAGKPCRIPFLNGGLFEEENKNHRNLIFDTNLFKNLFNFFDQYNFTIYEDDPNDHTVAVDPEMLGHIFENLLEDNKDKGAYYTPKEIVHYMCQESLIEYLTTWFESHGYNIISYTSIGNPEQPELFPVNQGRQGQLELEIIVESESKQIDRILIEKLLKKNLDDQDQKLIKKYSTEFNHALDRVKICDPAIGSGAFPMGLLHEIFTAKQTLHIFEFGNTTNFNASGVKLNIIQNSIYGVDIERGAVDIARLRFWLSLIVDEPEPKALPNLDYKIVVGNSLVSKLGDDIIDIDWNIDQTAHGLFGHDLAKQQRLLLKKISQEQKEFFSPDSDKKKLSADIRNLKIDLLINQLELMVKTQGQETEPPAVNFKDKKKLVKATEEYYESLGWKNTITQLNKLKTKPELPLDFFDWKLDFPEVMNEQVVENVGFDIVIGNPPYVRADNPEIAELRQQILNSKQYETLWEKWDLIVPFYERSLKLLSKKGVHSFIVSNSITTSKYAQLLQEWIIKNFQVRSIDYFENISVFDAGVIPIITFILKNSSITQSYKKIRKEIFSNCELQTVQFDVSNLKEKIFKKTFSDAFNPSVSTIKLGNICYMSVGMATNADELTSQGEFSKNDLISDTQDKNHPKKYVEGKNIKAYFIQKIRYIEYDNGRVPERLRRPTFRQLYSGEKILRGRVTPGVIDNTGIVCNDSIIVMKRFVDLKGVDELSIKTSISKNNLNEIERAKTGKEKKNVTNQKRIELEKISEKFSLKYILAILNSKYAFAYLNNFRRHRLENYFYPDDFRNLPIPVISLKIQNEFIDIVSQILALKSEGKDTTILEQQIDNLVYKLYELTYEEVKIIDPEFALTEQEYDAIKME
ncbi:Modification methylase BstVI [Planktothrix rubescens]|nr:Modification methylase BstVI [Planktothrix rubescens]